MELKSHYALTELLAMGLHNVPSTIQGWHYKATKENWQFCEVACQGGKGGKRREYAPPPEIMQQIRELYKAHVMAHVPIPLPKLPETTPHKEALSGSTQKQRQQADAREAVLEAIDDLVAKHKSQNQPISREEAIITAITLAKSGEYEVLAKTMLMACDKRGGGGKLPDKRTIYRWFAKRETAESLMPKVPQKNMVAPTWFDVFYRFYNLPSQPSVALAFKMFEAQWRLQGGEMPSIHQARRLLSKMGVVKRERGRKGAKELKNILPHKVRDFWHLEPAEVYSADGHQVDWEVLNPLSGLPFRPEITTVMDVGTRKIVGWSVGFAESRFTVLEALSHSSLTAIPAIWYVDWGKGFENIMMTDETVGLMNRLGITMKHSIAYNAQAKGAIERSHQLFTHAAKMFATYIGKDMDGEAKRQMFLQTRKEIKLQGHIINSPVPTWDEFKGFIEQLIADYNAKPHRSLPKDGSLKRHLSPNEFWEMKLAEMSEPPIKVAEDEVAYLFRPQIVRTVERGKVKLFNNVYFSHDLTEFHGLEVIVGYDVQDAEFVWIFDDNQRFICKAEWHGNSTDYFPKSVREQAKDKRDETRLKRIEAQKDKVLAERKPVLLEHQSSVNLGGLVVDLAQAKRETEAVLLPRAEIKPEPKTVEVLDAEGWHLPNTEAGRWAEWSRLAALSEADLLREPERAQRWLVSYTRTPEFKVMNKQVA